MPNRLAWKLNEATVTSTHLLYLNIGSNIAPEVNVPKAMQLLGNHSPLLHISSIWESTAIGTSGPNYWNACVSLRSPFEPDAFKETIIRSIEAQLGRNRTADKFAPRPMDIDIILCNDTPIGDYWFELAYVVVPLAEIYPAYRIPSMLETLAETATRLRQKVWLETR